MRVLLVNARRGFGNRVRATLSGAAYADATGARFELLWIANQQCGSELDALWTHPFREISLRRARVLARLGGGWIDHLQSDDVDLTRFRRPIVALHSSQAFSNPARRPWPAYFSRLQPLAEHRERMHRLWSSIPGDAPVIGAMVRTAANAHAETVRTDPLGYNVARLLELRAAHPECPIFLSTDSPETVDTVVEKVGGVWALPDKGPLNSARGIQDALCDTYLLASCSWILGSHGSSFSENAALIAGHGGYETSVAPGQSDIATLLEQPRLAPSRLWLASGCEPKAIGQEPAGPGATT